MAEQVIDPNRQFEQAARAKTGGPKKGSGRRPQAKPWVRSEPVRVLFRKSEWEALDRLAAAWDVPVATAVWALVADALEDRTGERAKRLVSVPGRGAR